MLDFEQPGLPAHQEQQHEPCSMRICPRIVLPTPASRQVDLDGLRIAVVAHSTLSNFRSSRFSFSKQVALFHLHRSGSLGFSRSLLRSNICCVGRRREQPQIRWKSESILGKTSVGTVDGCIHSTIQSQTTPKSICGVDCRPSCLFFSFPLLFLIQMQPLFA